MKSASNPAILNIARKGNKKVSYRQTASAIQKKLEEIKNENKQAAAVNNNLSLFRYKV